MWMTDASFLRHSHYMASAPKGKAAICQHAGMRCQFAAGVAAVWFNAKAASGATPAIFASQMGMSEVNHLALSLLQQQVILWQRGWHVSNGQQLQHTEQQQQQQQQQEEEQLCDDQPQRDQEQPCRPGQQQPAHAQLLGSDKPASEQQAESAEDVQVGVLQPEEVYQLAAVQPAAQQHASGCGAAGIMGIAAVGKDRTLAASRSLATGGAGASVAACLDMTVQQAVPGEEALGAGAVTVAAEPPPQVAVGMAPASTADISSSSHLSLAQQAGTTSVAQASSCSKAAAATPVDASPNAAAAAAINHGATNETPNGSSTAGSSSGDCGSSSSDGMAGQAVRSSGKLAELEAMAPSSSISSSSGSRRSSYCRSLAGWRAVADGSASSSSSFSSSTTAAAVADIDHDDDGVLPSKAASVASNLLLSCQRQLEAMPWVKAGLAASVVASQVVVALLLVTALLHNSQGLLLLAVVGGLGLALFQRLLAVLCLPDLHSGLSKAGSLQGQLGLLLKSAGRPLAVPHNRLTLVFEYARLEDRYRKVGGAALA